MRIRQGFTFIELLVVIAVIGTLLVLSVYIFKKNRATARDGERVSAIESLIDALAVARREGAYLCNGNGSAVCSGRVSDCGIFKNGCGKNDLLDHNITKDYIDIASLKDPAFSIPCEDGTYSRCDYTFTNVKDISQFQIIFSTEKQIEALGLGTSHTADQTGIHVNTELFYPESKH